MVSPSAATDVKVEYFEGRHRRLRETIFQLQQLLGRFHPIVPLPEKDYWFYLNSALNEVSEKFADGFIRRDAGHDLKTTIYVLCLTNECDGAIRTRKIRAMLIRKDDLLNLPEEMPALESKNHTTRWNTLLHMASTLESKPHQFFTVELVV